MRPSAVTAGKLLWVCLLALSIPWSGPSINPHVLEHEAENNRRREAVPPHEHQGVHFDALWDTDNSPDCFACLRSQTKGVARVMAPAAGPPDAPRIVRPPTHEHIAPFRLAGRVAARAPPRLPLHGV